MQKFRIFSLLIGLSCLLSCSDINTCVNVSNYFDSYFHDIQVQDTTAWKASHYSNDSEVFFTFEKIAQNEEENSRLRIQKNFYELNERIKQLEIEYDFLLDGKFNKLSKNSEFEWLTLTEIWHKPGWKNFENPIRTAFNVVKIPTSERLYLRVTMDEKSGAAWKQKKELIFKNPIRMNVNNNVKIEYRKGSKEELIISFNNEVVKANLSLILDSKDFVGVWGVNPIKFYTSNKVIERISSSNLGDKYIIKFSNPQVCMST